MGGIKESKRANLKKKRDAKRSSEIGFRVTVGFRGYW